MSANFDRVVWCYDFLASLVFGNKIKKSQILLLDAIKHQDRILIIGGGTGWILSEILQRKKSNTIDYVESSLKMLEQAKSITAHHSDCNINFIHGDESSIPEGCSYDSIMACYFFDMFQEENWNM